MYCTMSISPNNYTPCNSTWTCLIWKLHNTMPLLLGIMVNWSTNFFWNLQRSIYSSNPIFWEKLTHRQEQLVKWAINSVHMISSSHFHHLSKEWEVESSDTFFWSVSYLQPYGISLYLSIIHLHYQQYFPRAYRSKSLSSLFWLCWTWNQVCI